MFERILVPADLTERNRDAVDMARGLVAPNGSICLLHVIQTIPGVGVDEEPAFYRKLEERASAFLADLGTSLESVDVAWSAEVVYGSRVRSIVDEAKRLSADLIVIRSHRVSREPSEGSSVRANDGFGTLSYQVGVLAECPVLLVK